MRDVHLVCIGCGAATALASLTWRCPECGDLVEISYGRAVGSPQADWKQMWRQRRLSDARLERSGVWRFREMLPAPAALDTVVTLQEGNTPLYEMPRCGRRLGLRRLLAKHQGMNPTGSFKDTGMTVAISDAVARGSRWVACASTGNTAAAMAAYAARAGLASLVLIPDGKIAWGKLAQSVEYGAVTCQLPTDFDGCVRILDDVVGRHPMSLVNSVNPYRVEGQKTAAIEMLEQLDWVVPDHVMVPGGNLAHSSALGKAFIELLELGLIDRLPRLSIVQAEGANPLVRLVRAPAGSQLQAITADTLATAIQIGNPASWKKALRVLERSGGYCLDVTEAEIAAAKAEIGREGIGCEPASATTLAGVRKLVAAGKVQGDETVVLVLTGHLLKDPEYTLGFHRGEVLAGDAGLAAQRRPPIRVEASPDSILRLLEQRL